MSTTIEDFLNTASKGMWVTANKVNQGDVLQITSMPEIDDTTFKGKAYLVMETILERSKETLRLRLSATAVKNLVPQFGKNPSEWIGKRVRIAGKTMYAGLGKEGLIFVPA